MQLIEITEPEVRIKEHKIAVGIDFGTTNSLVAFSQNHKPYVIEMAPSIVGKSSGGKLCVMNEGIRSVKRLLSTSASSKQNIDPVQTSAAIFTHLKSSAEKHLNSKITEAVVTVPAYFDDGARNAVALAAKLAGLNVLRLISEPTAAAYAYGLENKSEGIYLVYDLGGGTFDVSILNMLMGVFQVLAVGGDSNLGGDDIDDLIAKKLGVSEIEAKKIKENLSFPGSDNLLNIKEFNKIILPLISRTMDITAKVLLDVDCDIDGIILVGGSSRIPLIKQELSRRFKVPVLDNLDPDRVVALGAALQAENLTSSSSDLLIDVVPLSLGMELMGGVHEKIIWRNTPIPAKVTKEFTTYADNQTAMQFHIVQGERELVADCRSLAKFELALKPAKAGTHRIEITFAIDADGLVSIAAKDKDTLVAHELKIKPTHGINSDDINAMLEEAFANSKEDHKAKLLREAEVEAQRVISRLRKT